ncbi:hypothetical protein [Rhodospirillum sp. A1_3_36]|uniref:hypothetical protein n=1 Tax=Rhodospirillum sp. A1_3_36 TaxID=3391666 RepID=UPI0039A4FFDF
MKTKTAKDRFLFFLSIVGVICMVAVLINATPQRKRLSGSSSEKQSTESVQEIDILHAFGNNLVRMGHATEYDIGVFRHVMDVHTGYTSPAEARAVADGICLAGRGRLHRGWTVRVYLVVGDRPSAQCEM